MAANAVDSVRRFLSCYSDWKSLDELISLETKDPQGRCALFPGTRVELHSLKSGAQLNSAMGIVGEYLGGERDRFDVRLVDDHGTDSKSKIFAVRAQNLRVCTPLTPETPHEFTFSAIEGYFFAPGTRYLGTIQIPGDAGFEAPKFSNSRQEYMLDVVGSQDDEQIISTVSSHPGETHTRKVLARHRAYGDEQYVYVSISVPSSCSSMPSFSIEYQDGETICRGRWDSAQGCLTGSVSQMVNTDDKIYHPSDEVTHTFALHPVEPLGTAVSGAFSRRRKDSNVLLQRCLGNLAGLRQFGGGGGGGCAADSSSPVASVVAALSSVAPGSCGAAAVSSSSGAPRGGVLGAVQADAKELAARRKDVAALVGPTALVGWRALVGAAALEAERCCARFRRFSECLDALTFDTPSHKRTCLSRLFQGASSAPLSEAAGSTAAAAAESGGQSSGHGLSLEGAHAAWDVASSTIMLAVEGWGLSARAEAEHTRSGGAGPGRGGRLGWLSPQEHRECESRLLGAAHRLSTNHERFAASVRRAEARLTRATVASYTRPDEREENPSAGAAAAASGDDCAICMTPLSENAGSDRETSGDTEAPSVHLPCAHSFHNSCIVQWLHNHVQCPMCRFEIKELDSEATS